jgi:molybdopterin synthase sulfur carrier subunit
MITVEFLGPISRPSQSFDIATLEELSIQLKQNESLKEWLPKLAVAVNDKIVKDMNYQFNDGDKISLLPPVCGG